MSAGRKIVANTFYQLVAKAVSALSTVVATALITRNLGISSFGAFFLMTGFATYFFLLVDFGINAIATREIAADQSLGGRYFSSILSLRLLYSAVLVTLLTLILPVIPFRLSGVSPLRLGIFIGLLAIIAQGIYNTCTIVFQARLDYRKALAGSVVGNTFFLLMAILIIFRYPHVLWLVMANTLGSFIVSLVSLYLVRGYLPKIRLGWDKQLWRHLLLSALPLGLTIFLTVIVSKADSFLLSVVELPPRLGLTNAAALGNYGLAYKVFENILVFPTYFVNALFPVMIIHQKESLKRLTQTLTRSLAVMLAISLLVVLLGYWLSPLAIFVLAGSAASPASILALRLLILGLPLFFSSSILMFFLITTGEERKLPGVYLVAAVFNIVLNLIYIPRYGFIASAVLTGITELLIFLFLGLISLQRLKSLRFSQ